MTIDEAIMHAEEKSGCDDCGREHAQLAAWLRELKQLRAELKERAPHWKDDGDVRNSALTLRTAWE